MSAVIITVDRQTKQALYLDGFTYRPLVDQTFKVRRIDLRNLDPPTDRQPRPSTPVPRSVRWFTTPLRCEPTNRTGTPEQLEGCGTSYTCRYDSPGGCQGTGGHPQGAP